MEREYLEKDVIPRLRRALERLENGYLDLIADMTHLPDSESTIRERFEDLRRHRETIEEAKHALEMCLTQV
jgi:hypothetical protein